MTPRFHPMLTAKEFFSSIFTTSFPFRKIFRQRKVSSTKRDDVIQESGDMYATSSNINWVCLTFSVMNFPSTNIGGVSLRFNIKLTLRF